MQNNSLNLNKKANSLLSKAVSFQMDNVSIVLIEV